MRLTALATTAVLALGASAGIALAADSVTPTIPYIPPPPAAPMAPMSTVQDWTGPYVGIVGGYGWGNFSAPIGAPANGFVAAIYGGYNVQHGVVVYGIEFDGELSRRETAGGDRVRYTIGVLGRVGVALGRFLVFGVGGVSIADITTVAPAIHGTEVGWVVGAGVDAAITDTLFARGEFLLSNYGEIGGSGGSVLTTSEFRAGIGVRF